MATTYTCSDQAAQPRANHVGVNAVRATRTSTTTLSVSDIVFAVKVPSGATIIDGYIKGTIDNAATIVKVGTGGVGGTDSNLLSAGTLSATSQMKRFDAVPFRVSVSDDAQPSWAWVYVTINTNASLTVSSSFDVVVEYFMGVN